MANTYEVLSECDPITQQYVRLDGVEDGLELLSSLQWSPSFDLVQCVEVLRRILSGIALKAELRQSKHKVTVHCCISAFEEDLLQQFNAI
jgi:hypothetical protein